MATSDVRMSITIYKGSPVDYPQYRHTAFWIQFDGKSTALLAHITGTAQMFEFKAQELPDPTTSRTFARMVEVGYLQVPATPSQVRQALQEIPIDNSSREFNCQHWIKKALKALVESGYISTSEYEKGLDGMVDAIGEAEDEEV